MHRPRDPRREAYDVAEDIRVEALRAATPALPPTTFVLDGRDHRTPLSDVAERRVGLARLIKRGQPKGFYPAEGTYGHEYLQVVRHRVTTTELQRRAVDGPWFTWMTDDWLHWHAMRERVLALPRDIEHLVCAGLGLGLMVHHIHAERPDIGRITVVEVDRDVVDLINPTLPDDTRFGIWWGDYYEYIATHEPPDAVLWDLAVGSPEETRPAILKGLAMTQVFWPDVPVSIFGTRLHPR